jgi:hypothetical protein
MKIKSKILFALTGAVAVSVGNHQMKAKKSSADFFAVSDVAFAKSLSPADIDMTTTQGRGDFARFLYFLVNGAGDTGHTFNGPEGGFKGMINKMTGRIGKEMEKAGYTKCSEIPTTGSKEITINHPEKGAMTLTLTFAAGTKTIPSHFGSYAGTAYTNRVTVATSGKNMMAMESYCGADTAIKTGYLVTSGDQFGKRSFEIYFQQNSTSNAGTVDLLHASSDTEGEKMATRFTTTDGDSFKLYMIRTVASGTQKGGAFFALAGTRSTNLVNLYLVKHQKDAVTDTTTALTSAAATVCMSINGDTVTESTGCATASDPTAGPSYGGSSLTWSIAGVAGASVAALN